HHPAAIAVIKVDVNVLLIDLINYPGKKGRAIPGRPNAIALLQVLIESEVRGDLRGRGAWTHHGAWNTERGNGSPLGFEAVFIIQANVVAAHVHNFGVEKMRSHITP